MSKSEPSDPHALFVEAVDSLQEALAYEKSRGNTTIPADHKELTALAEPITTGAPPTPATDQPEKEPPSMPSKKESIPAITKEIAACTGCQLRVPNEHRPRTRQQQRRSGLYR